jgi:peptidoglycan/xylan/chitin deacetylase (PgdA/CDA1 family)
MNRGVFTLSLDFELIWGTLDLFGPNGFRRACEIEREVIVDRLLGLLEEFGIPATWCIVGHLFLDHCDGKHADIIRPNHAWFPRDWFVHDPGSDARRDPIFYGRDLVEKIRACPVPQEIGSHSFSHVIFSDEGCSRATAESELAASVRAAREMGIEMRSFVFPRNEVGHLELLREYGFRCYRGPEPHWYEEWPGPVRRLAHLWDVVVAAEPPVVLPEKSEAGVWNIPGSMIYFPMHGVRRYIPVSLRVRRAVRGLEAAAREGRVFHLWFHPTNLADGTDDMFDGLRAIFERATALQRDGHLVFRSMGALAVERDQ